MNGAVVRQHAICVRDISGHGALFDCGAQLPPGSVGLLQVSLEGRARVEVFRVCRILTVPGSGAWRVGVEFLPVMPAGDGSLRAAVAGFDTTAGGTPHAEGLKSGAPMTSEDAAARCDLRHAGHNGDFTPFSGDLTPRPLDAVTGSPVAHSDDEPVTPRRSAPIEEDR
jgi:hypothetical protein